MGRGTTSAPASGISPQGLISSVPRPPLPAAPYLVVGLGRAGAAAARTLASRAGPSAVRVWDSSSDAPQRQSAQALRELGVSVLLGGDGLEALGGVRTVVKSPGVPWGAAVVAEASRRRLPIVDELEIGWRLTPAPTVAVTGTNGKSTVAALCVSVLDQHGLGPALGGNSEFGPPLSALSLGRPPRSVVLEVSSYQAEASPELAVDGAVFTNLTNDHLNRHSSMEAYGTAKRALFVRGERAVPLAALNIDDGLGRALARDVEERGGRALRYGRGADADYRIIGCRWGLREAELEIDTPEGLVSLTTRLPGLHNAANATSVLALADGLELPREPTLAALAGAAPVPGRFEIVDVGRPFDVVVDFAYSEGSVAASLLTARGLVTQRGRRLLTVLTIPGAIGPLIGRDVGRLARELSDHLILSGTSYRGEPRLLALAQLLRGARGAPGGQLEVVIDRRQAIARAMAAARVGDLVAILGRGRTAHEATDGRGGFQMLSDREAALAAA